MEPPDPMFTKDTPKHVILQWWCTVIVIAGPMMIYEVARTFVRERINKMRSK